MGTGRTRRADVQLPLLATDGPIEQPPARGRRSRSLDDLRAVLTLVRQGYAMRDAGRALGLTPGQVRRCLRLAALIPVLRAAAETGGLPLAVAAKAARQPPAVQDRLASHLAATGRLTEDDIIAIAASSQATLGQPLLLDWSSGTSANVRHLAREPEDTVAAVAEKDGIGELVYEPVEDRPSEDWWLTD